MVRGRETYPGLFLEAYRGTTGRGYKMREHDCMRDGCQREGSLFCIWCGLTEEETTDTEVTE